jgi:hypothetical protein
MTRHAVVTRDPPNMGLIQYTHTHTQNRQTNIARVRLTEFIHSDAKFGSLEGYVCLKGKTHNLSIEPRTQLLQCSDSEDTDFGNCDLDVNDWINSEKSERSLKIHFAYCYQKSA